MRLGTGPAQRGRAPGRPIAAGVGKSMQAPPPRANSGSAAARAPHPQPPPSPPSIPDPPPGHPHPAGSGHEVLVQAFHWDSHGYNGSWWRVVGEAADALAELGATAAWLPPPSASASAQGYLPTDLYSFETPYGSESDLRAAIAKLKAAGVAPVADAVLNHRCAAAADADGRWNVFSPGGPGAGAHPARPSLAWGPEAIVAEQRKKYGGAGRPSSAPGGAGALFGGAPNLDHSHPAVADGLAAYVRLLLCDLGFEGIRLDYAKGYGGDHAGRYLASAAESGGETGAALPRLAVGEFWDALSYGQADGGAPDVCQAAHAARLAGWVAATGGRAGAFDMTLKGVLQAALERGEYGRLGVAPPPGQAAGGSRPPRPPGPPAHPSTPPHLSPPGLLGLAPAHAFTFVDNHDTACQGHWPCPAACVPAAYAYVLSHPGTPCVHWRDVFPDDRAVVGGGGDGRRAALRAAVASLVRARRAGGVGAASPLSILYCRDAPRPRAGASTPPPSPGGSRPPPRVFHPNDFINACGGDAAAAAERAAAETAAAAAAWEEGERAAAAATPPPPPPPPASASSSADSAVAVGGYAAFVGPAPTAEGAGKGGLVIALGPAAAAADPGRAPPSEWGGPGPGWAVSLTGPGWAVWERAA